MALFNPAWFDEKRPSHRHAPGWRGNYGFWAGEMSGRALETGLCGNSMPKSASRHPDPASAATGPWKPSPEGLPAAA
ncbi:hypothetical protein CNECB9_1740011 [Cupriavidus necator]|uniref:Uncharacterized protein n=1 Tax=Cupriavidus necator TaxID=106590 RepID=A0A1K0J8Z0_CUPNE|nr:hypothetical protein CNECB9_1740011 [Cupriavidus necator]